MKKFLVVLAVSVSSFGISQIKYVDYKTGDNDARFTLGLLKTLFTDSLTKYEFGSIDPAIFRLNVYNNDILINSFDEWIKTIDISEYPSDLYSFSYWYPSQYSNSESISIVLKSTGELVRMVSIAYSGFDYTNNQYSNVISIEDFIIE